MASNVVSRTRASARAAGSRTERETAEYLQPRGFEHASRRVRTGARDTGDLNGLGKAWICEVKDCKTISLGTFAKEAAVEAVNAGARYWFLVIKRRMHGIKDAYAVTNLETFTVMLADFNRPSCVSCGHQNPHNENAPQETV